MEVGVPHEPRDEQERLREQRPLHPRRAPAPREGRAVERRDERVEGPPAPVLPEEAAAHLAPRHLRQELRGLEAEERVGPLRQRRRVGRLAEAEHLHEGRRAAARLDVLDFFVQRIEKKKRFFCSYGAMEDNMKGSS